MCLDSSLHYCPLCFYLSLLLFIRLCLRMCLSVLWAQLPVPVSPPHLASINSSTPAVYQLW